MPALVVQARAPQHRSALSFPEQILWDAVSGGKLGVYFRRQFVIARYIVDMLAPSIRLVVEVDGGCMLNGAPRMRAGTGTEDPPIQWTA